MAAETQLANWQNTVDNKFEFGKDAYLEAIPDLANASAAARGASALQGGAATRQAELAKSLSGRAGVFNGMQDQYSAAAFGANSPERQQQAADQAIASVASNAEGVRQQGVRQMERKGVNPGSGASLALNTQFGINQASAQAGAANKARQDLETVANDRQKTAIGFGANLVGQSISADQSSGILAERAALTAAAPVKNKLDFAGGISNIYSDAANGYKGLWTSQNLTPAQQAQVSANNDATSSADNAALLGALGQFASSDAGTSAWNYLFN